MKAQFDDRVITIREVTLSDGKTIPAGTHGFVIEAFEVPCESYEVEFYVEDDSIPGDDLILGTVGAADFEVA
jgi:hypothetical protein